MNTLTEEIASLRKLLAVLNLPLKPSEGGIRNAADQPIVVDPSMRLADRQAIISGMNALPGLLAELEKGKS